MGEKYQRLILPAEVESQTGLSKRQLRRMVAEGRFPKPIPLTARKRAWDITDFHQWLDERKAASSPRGSMK